MELKNPETPFSHTVHVGGLQAPEAQASALCQHMVWKQGTGGSSRPERRGWGSTTHSLKSERGMQGVERLLRDGWASRGLQLAQRGPSEQGLWDRCRAPPLHSGFLHVRCSQRTDTMSDNSTDNARILSKLGNAAEDTTQTPIRMAPQISSSNSHEDITSVLTKQSVTGAEHQLFVTHCPRLVKTWR